MKVLVSRAAMLALLNELGIYVSETAATEIPDDLDLVRLLPQLPGPDRTDPASVERGHIVPALALPPKMQPCAALLPQELWPYWYERLRETHAQKFHGSMNVSLNLNFGRACDPLVTTVVKPPSPFGGRKRP